MHDRTRALRRRRTRESSQPSARDRLGCGRRRRRPGRRRRRRLRPPARPVAAGPPPDRRAARATPPMRRRRLRHAVDEPMPLVVLGDSGAAGFGVEHPEQTTGAVIARRARSRARPPGAAALASPWSAPRAVTCRHRSTRSSPLARRRGHHGRCQRRHAPRHPGTIGGPAAPRPSSVSVSTTSRSWSAPAPTSGPSVPIPHPLRWVARRWSRSLAAAQTVAAVAAGARSVALADLLGAGVRRTPRHDVRSRPVPPVRRRATAPSPRRSCPASSRPCTGRAAAGSTRLASSWPRPPPRPPRSVAPRSAPTPGSRRRGALLRLRRAHRPRRPATASRPPERARSSRRRRSQPSLRLGAPRLDQGGLVRRSRGPARGSPDPPPPAGRALASGVQRAAPGRRCPGRRRGPHAPGRAPRRPPTRRGEPRRRPGPAGSPRHRPEPVARPASSTSRSSVTIGHAPHAISGPFGSCGPGAD